MRSRRARCATLRAVQQSLFGDAPPPPPAATGKAKAQSPQPQPQQPPPEPPPELPGLTAELEAALLRELRATYEWENHARFRKRLRAPMIVLSDATTRLGQWVSGSRRLELSRTLVVARPWPEVVSVLAHEMAHQFVDEVLQIRGETAHGESFRALCDALGIDGRAGGAPIPADDAPGDRVLERIRKLLALAGSDNQHEAEIAMRKAHELMLRHNIEVASANAALGYEVCLVGDPAKRTSAVESEIASLLSELFFVKVIQLPVYLPLAGKRGSLFELTGTRPNLAMASHVYAFLLATAERLWRDNRDDARVQSGRDRLAYQAGVIRGFRDKLVAERSSLAGTGLIWIGDADLEQFYRTRNPRITTRSRSVRVNGAHDAGREAGRTIVLNKPIERGSSGGPRKLLGK